MRKGKDKLRSARPGPDRAPAAPGRQLAPLSGWRLWSLRLALMISVPVLLLVLLEGVLRLVGYGYPTSFLLHEKATSTLVENNRFCWQFYSRKSNLRPNPVSVAAVKPADSLRIVVLGESAAAGTPEPAYNFGRILDRMLRHQFPQKRLEVINLAMSGINSHILLPIARDALALQPDLFVLYMGNNEAVGLYAPGPHSGRLTSHLRLLRAMQWARATRVGELLEPLFAMHLESAAAENQDTGFFEAHRVAADDPRRAAVADNFRANLAGICKTAQRGGSKVVLLTVGANLRDCPPFGCLHRAGFSDADQARWDEVLSAGIEAEGAGRYAQALTNYQAAAGLDSHFAELHFRIARCYEGLGQFDQARHEFELARDWDALQFRTDSRLNAMIRQTAAAPNLAGTVRLVDGERALAEAEPSDHGAPGDRFFSDHVHPNFDGDYVLAKTLLPAVREALASKLGQPAPNPAVLSRDECAAQLAYTRVNQGQIVSQMVRTTALPPFTCQFDHARRQQAAEKKLVEQFGDVKWKDVDAAMETYRAAIRKAPDDWWLNFNFARLCLLTKDYPTAIDQFRTARRQISHWPALTAGLSVALSGLGKYDEALQVLHEGLALNPKSETLQAGIASVQSQRLNAARVDAPLTR